MRLFSAMRFLALLLSLLAASRAAKTVEQLPDSIDADSEIGSQLLSAARRLDQNNNDIDFAWVAGYSLKFQGCHSIQQWNEDADEENDVRIKTKRLVRFRLCPNTSCSSSGSAGCRSGYGDYVVDLDTYVNAYFEASRKNTEYACQMHLNYNCNCDEDSSNNQGDDFNREYCEFDCFNDARMDQCIDKNPYAEESEEMNEEEFELERYMECAQLEVNNNNNQNGRALEDGNGNGEVQYYVGPYCADQGGKILLGMFTDDTCSEFADTSAGRTTYKELTGSSLPYASTSIVGSECLKCIEQDFNDQSNNNNNGDASDADDVSESCEEIYRMAGKCEENLPENVVMYDGPNNAACNYIAGIKIVRSDGIITGSALPSPVMTAFIVIFAMAFAALGFYVWYLRTRLETRQIRYDFRRGNEMIMT